MQTSPLRVMVPRPMAGILAPLASTTFIAGLLEPDGGCQRAGGSPYTRRSVVRPRPYVVLWIRFRGAQYGEGNVGRLVDDLEQSARGPARRALALLPVAHGLDRHADARGEFGLRELGARAHAARVRSVRRRAIGEGTGRNADGRRGATTRRIEPARQRALAAVGKNLDDPAVGFQSHPHH